MDDLLGGNIFSLKFCGSACVGYLFFEFIELPRGVSVCEADLGGRAFTQELVRDAVAVLVVLAVDHRDVGVIGTEVALMLIFRDIISVFHHLINRPRVYTLLELAHGIASQSSFDLLSG